VIPILQFDPSSLTLWYDAHVIARIRGSREIGHALDLALRGDDAATADHVHSLEDDWIRTRAANVASAVWHEKRHFLDFTLTNYGAFRVRQFMIIAMNMAGAIAEAQKVGHIVAPIGSWLSGHLQATLGVATPSGPTASLCHMIRHHKAILNEDRTPVDSRFGRIEVGGEALLEAIAHLVQTGKTHRVFGANINASVQKDVETIETVEARYKWAYRFFVMLGLMSPPTMGEPDPEGFRTLLVDDGPIIPLCYAALACRFYGQDQINTPTTSSSLPKARLASLGIGLQDVAKRFAGLSAVDCWDVVQHLCRDLFGRTVVQEMEADYEHEQRLVERLRSEDGDGPVLAAYEDFHVLRGKFMAVLRDDPGLIIDQARWADEMTGRLQPQVIVAATAGELGDPPSGYERVLGYDDPHVTQDIAEKRWWWAATPLAWPEYDNPTMFNLKARDAWLAITSSLAPVAKLLIDGRRSRTMLGPELIRAEGILSGQFGLKVLVDPRFAYPPSTDVSTAYWRWLTGFEDFRCDMSFETVRAPEGKVLSPWALRLKKGLVEKLLGDLRADYVRHLHFWRDWSPYLLNEEFKQIVESFEDDPSPFISRITAP
jgi:hypothetical protein